MMQNCIELQNVSSRIAQHHDPVFILCATVTECWWNHELLAARLQPVGKVSKARFRQDGAEMPHGWIVLVDGARRWTATIEIGRGFVAKEIQDDPVLRAFFGLTAKFIAKKGPCCN